MMGGGGRRDTQGWLEAQGQHLGHLTKEVKNGEQGADASALVFPWLLQSEHTVLKGEERSWPDLLSVLLFCLPVGFIKCAGTKLSWKTCSWEAGSSL